MTPEGIGEPLRVLLVEDSEDDAELNLLELKQSGFAPEALRVETSLAMTQALESCAWDIVLSDFQLPAFEGFGALRLLQTSGQDIPFILVSGAIGEEVAVAVLKAGAHDCVLKGNLARLGPVVSRELREARGRRERRAAERNLRVAEERYRDLFEHSPIPTWVADFSGVRVAFEEFRQTGRIFLRTRQDLHPEGLRLGTADIRILDMNRASLRLLGIQCKEDIPDHLPGFFEDASWPVLREAMTALAGGADAFQSEIPVLDARRGRRVMSINLSVSPGFEATLGRVLVSFLDLTERVEAERLLMDSQTSLEQAQRIARLGSWEWDLTQERLSWSPQLFALLGQTPSDPGPTYDEFVSWVHPDDRPAVLGAVEEVISSGQAWGLEYRIQRADGTLLHVHERAELLPDDKERPFRLHGTIQDITERKRMEAALKDMERLSAKGQMAAYIAHEINNPLAGIKNAFALLERAIPPDHAYARYGGLIKKEIDRIAGIIRTMYHVYRPPSTEAKAISIRQAFQDLENLVEAKCRAANVHCEVVMEDPDLLVVMNEGLLRQVLFNLVLNAIDASREGGCVNLGAGLEPGWQLITVEDQGTGIPPELAERIFEPGFTTKRDAAMSGLGLGLSACRSILASLGGTLTFRSHPPEPGTRFEMRLPFLDPQIPCSEELP
ncbi:MAG TPA: ATP-binding protein [Holophaga sp.]|nr:ATP-binding protein [Holophaga sp.]